MPNRLRITQVRSVIDRSKDQKRTVRSLGLHVGAVRVGRRLAVLSVTAILSAANATSIVILVHLLVNGARISALYEVD